MKSEFCTITESVKVIGTKPRLLIVRHLSDGELCFTDLRKACQLSSRTLALNLKFMVGMGILSSAERENRNFYSLTKSGQELVPIMRDLGSWGERWDMRCPEEK